MSLLLNLFCKLYNSPFPDEDYGIISCISARSAHIDDGLSFSFDGTGGEADSSGVVDEQEGDDGVRRDADEKSKRCALGSPEAVAKYGRQSESELMVGIGRECNFLNIYYLHQKISKKPNF